MADYCEPMDVEEVEVNSEDKENAFRHNGPGGAPGPRTPSAEKGCEELDVSELNMRLRLSCTPLASPTPPPRRFTGSCKKLFSESGDNDTMNRTITNDNANVMMTEWSMGDHNGNNSSLSEQDSTSSTIDSETANENKNTTILHQSSNSPISSDCIVNNNATITIETNHQEEKTSTPTVPIPIPPVDTTPTKEIPKASTSPIMRGLKSVLSMFRPSQSPITLLDNDHIATASVTLSQDRVSPALSNNQESSSKSMLASTPVQGDNGLMKPADQASLGSNPQIPGSIVFNEDLINDLQWNDDTTIIFNKNKFPGRKLYTPSGSSFGSYSRDSIPSTDLTPEDIDCKENILQECARINKAGDTTVEYMDISMNDSNLHYDQATYTNQDHGVNMLEDFKQTEFMESIVENVFEKAKKPIQECSTIIAQNDNNGNPMNVTTNTATPFNETVTIMNDSEKSKHIADIILSQNKYVSKSSEELNQIGAQVESACAHVQACDIKTENDLIADIVSHLADQAIEFHTSITIYPDIEEDKYFQEIGQEVSETMGHSQLLDVQKDESIQEEDIQKEDAKQTTSDIEEKDVMVNNTPSNSTIDTATEEKAKENTERLLSTELLNYTYNKECPESEEMITSENNSPYVSLNAPSDQDIIEKLPVAKALELDIEAIDNPFATKCRVSMTPPRSEIIFDQIQNPFLPKSRISISPLRNISIDNVVVCTNLESPKENYKPLQSDIKIDEKTTITDELPKAIVECLLETVHDHTPSVSSEEDQFGKIYNVNDVSMEYKESIDLNVANNISNVQDTKNLTIALESISTVTPSGSDIVNSIESQEQSDDYLSADSSGRESEMLLDSELELVEKHHGNSLHTGLDGEFSLENPFETKTKIRMSPPLEDAPLAFKDIPEEAGNKESDATEIKRCLSQMQNYTPQEIQEQPITDTENPFETKTKIRMSPPLEDSSLALKDISEAETKESDATEIKIGISQMQNHTPKEIQDRPITDNDNPFETKTKIRMSPPLENAYLVLKDIPEAETKESDATEIKMCLSEMQNYTPQKNHITDNENPFETKTKIRMSSTPDESLSNVEEVTDTECENPFATKTKLSMSPPLQALHHNSPLKAEALQGEPFENNEHSFETKIKMKLSPPIKGTPKTRCQKPPARKSKIYMSPPLSGSSQKNQDQSTIDIENPFQTKTKIRMSPTPTEKEILAVGCENSIATKMKIRMSPTPQSNCSLRTEEVIEDENPFKTKSKISMSMEDIPSVMQDSVDTNEKPCGNECHVSATENYSESKVEKEITKEDKNIFEIGMRTSPTSVEEEIASIPIEMSLTQEYQDNVMPSEMWVSPLKANDARAGIDDTSNTDVENPFSSKTKVKMSPPTTPGVKNVSEESYMLEDPFTTKKIRMSPPLSQSINSVTFLTFGNLELLEKEEQVNSGDVSVNQQNNAENTYVLSDNDIAIQVEREVSNSGNLEMDTYNQDIGENDATTSSGGSNLSHDTNETVKEVKTEDEDTIEGPDFVDLDNMGENPFETKSKIRISTPVFDGNGENKSPKIIICSDMAPAQSMTEAVMPEEEFMECTDEEFKPGELFINADTFDFLMNQNAASSAHDNGKESLFLKFDPLCSKKRNSSGLVSTPTNIVMSRNNKTDDEIKTHRSVIIHKEATALDNVDHVFVTPEKNSATVLSYTPENSINSKEQYNLTASSSTPPEKPMMAVSPAINNDQVINARNPPYTPTRPERRSMNFASPAIAAIDRLISLSGNNSPANQTYYMENASSTQESSEAVFQLQALLIEKENEVEQLKFESKELRDRLTDLEIQMKGLQDDNDERLKKINDLKGKLAHKTALNKNMAAVVEEYERAISGMIGENEQEKQRHERERASLVQERDEQIAHLNSMEVSFSDLHTKYERTKQVILTYKANEEALRKTIDAHKDSLQKMETNYEALKQQAISKLNNANVELDKMKRSHEAEVMKLKAQVKRKELHATSLEESLAQKIKANEELTAICDELISKVG